MVILLALACAEPQPAPDAPWLVETFDGPDLPDGWEVVEVAHDGAGPAASLGIRDGALVATVHREDRVFRGLLRTIPVRDAAWIRVRARLRADGVDPTDARLRNCDVFARFDHGPVEATEIVTGSVPWRTVERFLAVPPDARELHVGAFLSMPGTAAFDDLEIVPVDPGWTVLRDGPFTYHVLPGDTVTDADRAANRQARDEAAAFFGVATAPAIDYWKYPDNATKGAYTGRSGNGHAERSTSAIHTIWSRERHEIVHLLSPAWGTPPPLIDEGIAVWLSGAWWGEPVRDAAAKLGDRWIPVRELAARFPDLDGRVTYPEAGAFVGWILATRGDRGLRALFEALPPDAGPDRLAGALGMSLDAADERLRTWIARD